MMKPPVWEIEQRGPTREELDDYFLQGMIHNAKNEIRLANESINQIKGKIERWENLIALLESPTGKEIYEALRLTDELKDKPYK